MDDYCVHCKAVSAGCLSITLDRHKNMTWRLRHRGPARESPLRISSSMLAVTGAKATTVMRRPIHIA